MSECTGPIHPSYCEIVQRSASLAQHFPHVTYTETGPTTEGRPIPVLYLGDRTRDLPLLMITGGTHGSEETGRAASMAFAEWLTGEGAAHLERLSAVVIPCLNPDGTERDSYHNAQNINVYKSYRFSAPSLTPEGRAAEELALDILPDCYVDVHGLAGGYMGDSEYVTPTLPSNQGVQIGYAVAAEMDAAAEAVGFPQGRPWMEVHYREEPACLCDKLALLTNALCFTLEITENYYPLEESIRSGLVRLQKLVEIGQRTHWNQPYPGFPCDTLSGSAMAAVMPFGNTNQKRRESRRDLIRLLTEDERTFERSHADPKHVATLVLRLDTPPATPPEGIVLQLALDPRVTVKTVRYQFPQQRGTLRETSLHEERGFTVWSQSGIRMLRASIPHPPTQGENRLLVEYEAPFTPHVLPQWKEFSYERDK